jgi:PKD repeat protein
MEIRTMLKRSFQLLIILLSQIFVGYLIKGSVIEQNGKEVTGVTVNLGRASSMNATTESNGGYQFGILYNKATAGRHSVNPLSNYDSAIKDITISKERPANRNAVPRPVNGTIGGINSIADSPDRLVCTYYFYWYDVYGGPNVFTDHPPDTFLSTFSFTEVSWHKREILDMISAGIDVMLPVYLGDDRSRQNWSIVGLEKLISAQEELISEGYNPPKIGLFLDTTALKYQNKGQLVDLTQDYGKVMFYKMIRDFYSIVPAQLRAEIDGKPIMWFYSAGYASAYDQETFNYIYNHFQYDFNGIIPYIIIDASWQGVDTENSYGWGSALYGPMLGGIASIGPGFNDTGYIPYIGGSARIKDREDGQYYIDSWKTAIDSGRRIIVIETWNELGEATEICNSREYGRKYIDITRDYVNLFKAMPDYKNESMVWWGIDVNEHPIQKGLITTKKDGILFVQKGGKEAIYAENTIDPESYYVYFDVNNDFIHASQKEVWVQVEYFDGGVDTFTLEYDSTSPSDGVYGGAYTRSEIVPLSNTNQWKIHTFHLPDAYFGERQGWKSDFRLSDNVDGVNYFSRIWVYNYDPNRFPTPPPTARFMPFYDQNNPYMLEFIDLSTGYIDNWDWNFGDAGRSSESSPIHKFIDAGYYTVSLTVSGPGGSITEKKNILIDQEGQRRRWATLRDRNIMKRRR